MNTSAIILEMTCNKRSLALNCFSPPVMLATFLIEIVFAVYVLWRYKLTRASRLVVSILVCLAAFQAAEFAVCGGLGFSGNGVTRLGYGAITLLPPLGLHLAYAIKGRRFDVLLSTAYTTCVAFLVYFVFMADSITGHTCYANYAVFDTSKASSQLYGLYYYGWLIISTALSWYWASSSIKRVRRSLLALSVGYLAFLIPTTTVNLIDQSSLGGIPSIMCGFAVILAFILVGKVAPESLVAKSSAHHFNLRLHFRQ